MTSTPAITLPTFLVLQSVYNKKYLRYLNEQGQVHGLLKFSGEVALSQYTKYEVVKANVGNGLVHLKCSHNNKYWVRLSHTQHWIAAAADKPEEDKSKWTCTLFEPIFIDANTVRFRHVQLGHYACLWRAAAPHDSCLFGGAPTFDKDQCDVYTIINWDSLVKLPSFLVLQSFYNKKYLRYLHEEGPVQTFFKFSADEALNPYTKYEVETAKNAKGLVHIKCCYNNKYWVRPTQTQNWIVAGADKQEEDKSKWTCTLFEPIFIDAKTVQFRHVQLGFYACLWRAAAPHDSCLFAGAATVDKDQCDVYTIQDWESLAILPRFLALKSNYNNKYLRYINKDGPAQRYLKFFGEEVESPYTKYKVELANIGKGLVHIKCCYNNKYWVRESESGFYIVARANEPEEDQSKWSCTLFEPVLLDAKTLRFRHVQLGYYACLWRSAAPFSACLYASSPTTDKDQCDVYTIIDWESLMILPKFVAFKGDNGNYLVTSESGGHQYLQYSSNDKGDPAVGNEVFTVSDGSVRIKSSQVDRFWRRSPSWIWADSNDSTTNNSDTLFWPIKVDNNVVALRNMGSNRFCKRLTTDGLTSCLNASISTVTKEARMEVDELVISRNIYYVDFCLMDATVYDESVLTMATGIAVNKTQEPNTIDVRLSYTNTKSNRWNSNVTLKLDVKTTIETDVPLFVDGKIEILDHFSGAYQWGKTETYTDVVEVLYKVAVPPMTTVTVNLLATKGSCDVPFSYSQADTLFNGENITYDMEDGVYTGINCYNFKYETKQEPL